MSGRPLRRPPATRRWSRSSPWWRSRSASPWSPRAAAPATGRPRRRTPAPPGRAPLTYAEAPARPAPRLDRLGARLRHHGRSGEAADDLRATVRGTVHRRQRRRHRTRRDRRHDHRRGVPGRRTTTSRRRSSRARGSTTTTPRSTRPARGSSTSSLGVRDLRPEGEAGHRRGERRGRRRRGGASRRDQGRDRHQALHRTGGPGAVERLRRGARHRAGSSASVAAPGRSTTRSSASTRPYVWTTGSGPAGAANQRRVARRSASRDARRSSRAAPTSGSRPAGSRS